MSRCPKKGDAFASPFLFGLPKEESWVSLRILWVLFFLLRSVGIGCRPIMNRTVSLREHRQPEHIVCHFDIIHRFSGKVQHRHLYHGRGRAVCGSFVLTVLTVIDHFMHRAALGRLRILRHQHCADPAAPGVRRADLCSPQAAVSADSYFLKSPTAVESHIIQDL